MDDNLSQLTIWVLLTLTLSIVFHYSFVLAYPYLVMAVAIKRGLQKLGKNTITHADKPTAAFRDVVRPSPDLIYSGCVFDVSEKPIRIRAKVPDTYMSLSMYRDNTDNFFSTNDRQINGQDLDIVLVAPGALHPQHTFAQVVEAPSKKGILLFRYFYGSEAQTRKLEIIRRQTIISPYSGGE
jgi:uncharacterized membrane protein